MNSSRYSFKIEFDHYQSANTYYGLDKLCLNNIIQDNTYMKDYISYKLMDSFGVASPLCSYVFVTVNGEDFGLYLAVEAVEESFLERNYGADYGELYKPDSMNFGGGRGNGKDFNMEDFDFGSDSETAPANRAQGNFNGNNAAQRGERPGNMQNQGAPEGTNFDRGSAGGFNRESFDPSAFDKENFDASAFDKGNFGNFGGMGGFGGMGSNETKLQYTDDEFESYSAIFQSAKTDITDADKKRLINSLKLLSQKDAQQSVSIDEVMRYFVVHTFLCNGDSYTGNMVHNYYLYEKDGLLSMIPWDYNLAFGTFSSGDATGTVNSPIDSPVSGGDISSRPMIAWVLEEEYIDEYHALYQEFADSMSKDSYLEKLVEETARMIAPYVEKDPTKFCTYEEFEKGSETIANFVVLRLESVLLQLSGEIGITTQEQQENKNRVDASSVTISDMGSMGSGMGRAPGGDSGKGAGGFPQGEMPNFNMEDIPNFPQGEMPNFNMEGIPNFPQGEMPNFNMEGIPNFPQGEMPSFNMGEAPNFNMQFAQ